MPVAGEYRGESPALDASGPCASIAAAARNRGARVTALDFVVGYVRGILLLSSYVTDESLSTMTIAAVAGEWPCYAAAGS